MERKVKRKIVDIYNANPVANNINNIPDAPIPSVVYSINIADQPNKHPIKKAILTDFVTTKYIGSYESSVKIFLLTVTVFNSMIEEYILTHPALFPLGMENKIIFMPKGGIILGMVFNKYLENINYDAKVLIKKRYENSFKKSDMDFNLIINKSIPDANYEIIYNDMISLSYLCLEFIRNEIKKNTFDYLDYHKYNKYHKLTLLRELREKLNAAKESDIDFICNLIHDNVESNEPCILNYRTDLDSYNYDSLINYDPTDRTKSITRYLDRKNSDLTITTNNTLNIELDPTHRYIFGLLRLKVFFSMYYSKKGGDNKNNNLLKLYGELIDVSVMHKSSTANIYVLFDPSVDLTEYTLDDISFKSYNIEYIIHELQLILFNTNGVYDISKYDKRLRRLFILVTLDFFNKKKYSSVATFLRKIEEFKIIIQSLNIIDDRYTPESMTILSGNIANFEHPDYTHYYYQLSDGTNYTIVHDLFKDIIKQINVPPSENMGVKVTNFCALIISNLTNMKEILKKSRYVKSVLFEDDNSVSMPIAVGGRYFDGFMKYQNKLIKMSNDHTNVMSGGTYGFIIKHYKYANIYNDLIKIFTNFYSLTTIHKSIDEIFYQAYAYLFSLYKHPKVIDQIFTNDNGETLYDSTTDTNKMLNPDGSRKILYNDEERIISFAFLSYLMEYHAFLKTYKHPGILPPNTIDNKTNNNYELIWDSSSGGTLKTIYKQSFNSNINELLFNFVKELDDLFKRCMINLVINLKKEINALCRIDLTLDEIKNAIFEQNETRINKYTRQNECDFIYHCWEKNVIELTRVKLGVAGAAIDIQPAINTAIKNSILYISAHDNGSAYNTMTRGFFSWMHFYDDRTADENIDKKYSCCITASIIEIVLLSRLYRNIDLINVQNNIPFDATTGAPISHHIYHTITQLKLSIACSHWIVSDNGDIYREIYTPGNPIISGRGTITARYNLNRNKKEAMLFLCLPSIDFFYDLVQRNRTIPNYQRLASQLWFVSGKISDLYDSA